MFKTLKTPCPPPCPVFLKQDLQILNLAPGTDEGLMLNPNKLPDTLARNNPIFDEQQKYYNVHFKKVS